MTDNQRTHWSILTGTKAKNRRGKNWNSWLPSGVIGIGYINKDLRHFSSRSELIEAVSNEIEKTKNDGEAAARFLYDIKIDDIIIALFGYKAAGYGIVISDYEFNKHADDDDYRHSRRVEWLAAYSVEELVDELFIQGAKFKNVNRIHNPEMLHKVYQAFDQRLQIDADRSEIVNCNDLAESVITNSRRRKREGQNEFRSAIMRAFNGQCCVTGCSVPEALEAAHVEPYKGRFSNMLDNGLLLRTDIHRLYDTSLISFEDNKVKFNPGHKKVLKSSYPELEGKIIANRNE